MRRPDTRTDAMVATLAAAWLEFFECLAKLPRERWDVLLVQVTPVGRVILYPDKCIAPFARWEVPSEGPPDDHFELTLQAPASSVSCLVPSFDELRVREEDEAAQDAALRAWLAHGRAELGVEPLSRSDFLALQDEVLRASLAVPPVARSLSVLGGPEAFGVHVTVGTDEAAWCVNYRRLWGRALPSFAPARTTLGALMPLMVLADVRILHRSYDGDTLTELELAGSVVNDVTLELLSADSAAVCGSLAKLVLTETAVTPAGAARLRALLPHAEIVVR